MPGKRDVGEVRVERHRLRPLALLEPVPRLPETPPEEAHVVVAVVVQLCANEEQTLF